MSDISGDPPPSPRNIPGLDPNQVLREKLAFYEEQFPGYFFRQRADWSFQHIDPRVGPELGLDAERCIRRGEEFFARIHPKDRPRYLDGLLRFAEGRATRTLRYRLVDAEGRTTHHLLEVRQPLRLASGLLLGYSGVWFDMSLQADLEAQVTFQAWQRSIGRITRILLHDFRNAMTGLQTLLELYSRQLDPGHKWEEGFRLMLDTTQRTQATVERLSQLVRDEPQEDSVFSLRYFIEGERGFWKGLWSRPIEFPGATDLPEDFGLEADLTTLRRFWLQFLLLHKPMEDEVERITFTWRPVQDGQWVVAEAFPFGLRATSEGLHLTLDPCPSPWKDSPGDSPAGREWPDAEWRQVQEFADALKIQIAFAPGEDPRQSGRLHLFFPAAACGSEAPRQYLGPAGASTRSREGTPQVLLHGTWEREVIADCLGKTSYEIARVETPPAETPQGVVFLQSSLDDAWRDWLRSGAAPKHLIYLHPMEVEPPADLPESVFTLPTRLPENRSLLELQLAELMR